MWHICVTTYTQICWHLYVNAVSWSPPRQLWCGVDVTKGKLERRPPFCHCFDRSWWWKCIMTRRSTYGFYMMSRVTHHWSHDHLCAAEAPSPPPAPSPMSFLFNTHTHPTVDVIAAQCWYNDLMCSGLIRLHCRLIHPSSLLLLPPSFLFSPLCSHPGLAVFGHFGVSMFQPWCSWFLCYSTCVCTCPSVAVDSKTEWSCVLLKHLFI